MNTLQSFLAFIRYDNPEEDTPRLRESNIGNFLYIIGSTIIVFLLSLLTVSTLGFLFSIPVGSYVFFLSVVLSCMYCLFISSVFFRRYFFVTVFAIILLEIIFSVSFIASALFLDLSYDGQSYHQEGIYQLYHGWNPYTQELTEQETNNLHKWVNHYPKGAWIAPATIFTMTNNIEQGKVIHFILLIASCSLSIAALVKIRKIPKPIAIASALLLSLNPVTLYQSASFYIDGQIASLLVSLFSVSLLVYLRTRQYMLFLIFAILVLLINMKFTALIYCIVFIAGLFLFLWYTEKIHAAVKTFITLTTSIIIGLGIIGFNPYITNTIREGHPLYPAAGANANDYITPNMPSNFIGKSSLEILTLSIFSKSDNVKGPGSKAELKTPFMFSQKEITTFRATNAKEGGFGPLFSGEIVLTALLFGIAIASKKYRKQATVALLITSILIVSAILNPSASLARFVPQIAIIPVIGILLGFYSRSIVLSFLSILIIFTAITNNLLIAQEYYTYNYKMTKEYQQKLEMLAKSSVEKPLVLHFGEFRTSGIIRFQQAGVQFKEMAESKQCREPKRLFSESIIVQCSNE